MALVPPEMSSMRPSSDRRPPNLERECPRPVEHELHEQLASALRERHARRLPPDHRLDIAAVVGDAAAAIVVVVGTDRRAHEVFVCARGPGEGLEGPLAAAVDVVDGILQGVVGTDDAFVPLDWEGRAFEGGVVFVRGEVRDYVAEEAAAALLGEDLPPRAIGPGHRAVGGAVTR